MRGRWAPSLLLSAASIVFTVFLLEIAIRIVQPQPLAAVARSSRLGLFHKPNTTLLYERSEFKNLVHYSSAGLRDREYPFHKPQGVFRIAVLGDSFVEGKQVPIDSTFCKQLEARLQAAPPDGLGYEAINFGVGGYGSCQEMLLLEELAFRFEPDLVLCVQYANDVDDDAAFRDCSLNSSGVLHVAPPAPVPLKRRADAALKSFLYQHSHLWVLLRSRHSREWVAPYHPEIATLTQDTAVPECPGRHDRLDWRLTLRNQPGDTRRAVDLLAATWEQMGTLCATHHADFRVVLTVSATSVDPVRWRKELSDAGCVEAAHDPMAAHDRVLHSAERRSVPVIDLLPALRAGAEREPLYYQIDGHWNSVGHREVAQALYEAVRNMRTGYPSR